MQMKVLLLLIMQRLVQSIPRHAGCIGFIAQPGKGLSTVPSNSKLRLAAKKTSVLKRADRVLAHRAGKARADSHNLLKQKRVWIRTDHSTEPPQKDHFSLIHGPSSKIRSDADIWIDCAHMVPPLPPLLSVYHKNKWRLSVRSDPMNRPCIRDILPDLHPVGRLDYDSSGLLLFSSSGALTQYLLHPKHQVEKEYLATVAGKVDFDELSTKLRNGVTTSEGIHFSKLLSVSCLDTMQSRQHLENALAAFPEHYNMDDLEARGYLDIFRAESLSMVRLVVTEGKHRMVRRVLANCGFPVVDLKRERIGEISLLDLAEGETRTLDETELMWAESLLQTPRSQEKRYIAKSKRPS